MFEQRIYEIVEDFLETAVVVEDDPRPLSRRSTPEASSVGVPARTIRGREQYTLDTSPTTEALEAEQQDHPLEAKALIDAFAALGIVCSLIAPEKGSDVESQFLKVAARADLIVLDWQIHRDHGGCAKQLLKALVAQDRDAECKRLRLVALYSGEDRLDEKIDELRRHLDLPATAKTGDLTLTHSNLRIAAFNKPLGASAAQSGPAHHVAETKLPGKLVSEFARLTDGIVPAVTLAALTAVRADTHRLLLALSARLDVGYLGHRAVSHQPDDASGHIVDMVAAEIGSVINEADPGKHAGMPMIDAWLARERGADPPLRSGSVTEPSFAFSHEDVDQILRVGLGDDHLEHHTKPNVLNEKKLKRIRKTAANLFTSDAATGHDSADAFSMRMAVRTIYSRSARALRLGTIVCRDGQYLLCVQPRCDSVRIQGEERHFLFLPLKRSAGDGSYDMVVDCPRPDSELIRLRVELKPYELLRFEFKGGENGTVQAKPADDETWAFADTSETPCTWIAELKPEFGQRVAAMLATAIARVGLSESEQLRLSQG